MNRTLAGAAFVALWALAPGLHGAAFAQTQQPAQQPAAASTAPLNAGQLDALMAPVALYPDQLLAKLCIAATYPLEVVEAERWVQKHADLKGSALDAALAKQGWDQSVKDLVKVPTVLKMMSEQIEWTRKVGDAFLSQQADLMAAVQRLRTQAQKTGALKDTSQQTVSTQDNAVVIEPVQPDQPYVPYYESSVYGDWAYPAYPPYYWGPPAGYGAVAGIGFIAGLAIGAAWWNNGFNWGGGNAYVNHYASFNNFNNYNFNRNNGQQWRHHVEHRRGVGYGNERLRQQYGRNRRTGAEARQNFRGFGQGNGRGPHVAHRGQHHPSFANRAGRGDHAFANRGYGGGRFAENGRGFGNRGGFGGGGHRGFGGGGHRGGGHRGGGRGGGRRR